MEETVRGGQLPHNMLVLKDSPLRLESTFCILPIKEISLDVEVEQNTAKGSSPGLDGGQVAPQEGLTPVPREPGVQLRGMDYSSQQANLRPSVPVQLKPAQGPEQTTTPPATSSPGTTQESSPSNVGDTSSSTGEDGGTSLPAEEEEVKSGIDLLRESISSGRDLLSVEAYLHVLSVAEMKELSDDTALLAGVGAVLSAEAYHDLLKNLGLPLYPSLLHLQVAGSLADLNPVVLAIRLVMADPKSQCAIVTDKTLYAAISALFPNVSQTLWGNLIASPLFGSALLANTPFAMGILLQDLEKGVTLIGGPNVGDGNLRAIIPSLGYTWTVAAIFLPKGEAQSQELKLALRRYAELGSLVIAKQCFHLRFNVDITGRLENAAGTEAGAADPGAVSIDWSNADILEVWDQLAVLPVADVSENTVLSTFQAISGTGGFWDPNANAVMLGQAASPAKMDHTVRHEIGHAVHTRREGAINAWLFGDIGFVPMSRGGPGMDELIAALGGYPEKYTDAAGAEQDFTWIHKAMVTAELKNHCGSGKWAGITTLPTDRSTWSGELYLSMPAALQQCLKKSSPRWYNNYASHAQGPNGSYFYNHYYNQPYWFSARAKAAIAATGDSYSAMSHMEFFANCYAEYFKDPAGFADHSKWGGGLPGDVQSFFSNHIRDKQPYTIGEKIATAMGIEIPSSETAREPCP